MIIDRREFLGVTAGVDEAGLTQVMGTGFQQLLARLKSKQGREWNEAD